MMGIPISDLEMRSFYEKWDIIYNHDIIVMATIKLKKSSTDWFTEEVNQSLAKLPLHSNGS